tara:strand:+ start:3863 stop:4744 length:882 start_codon:yes stop_codon:yes gene_type:complete
MKDFKAIFNTYSGKIKKSVGLKKEFGDKFIHGGYEKNTGWYYERMFFSKISSLNFLNEYLSKRNFSSVLEIGCSTGLLPKFMYEIFNNSEYTGLDLSEKSLTYAKKNYSAGNFIQGDFLKMELMEKFELILSLDVIDHVYDPDAFLKKIIKKTKKFGFIRAYRGYFEEIDEHVMEYRANEGIYLNDLSIKKIRSILEENNITNYQLLKQSSREKKFFDSDLGRKWKRSDMDERKKILDFTGFTNEVLEKLPISFETSDNFIKKSKNKISSSFLDLPKSYDEMGKPHLIIIFEK